MKKNYIMISVVALIFGLLLSLCVIGCKKNEGSENTTEQRPINITILLDLSDRLTRDLTPSQFDRDTAIVNYISDQFIDITTKGNNLSKSKNNMRIMFYPQPKLESVATLASELDIDLAKADPKQKKQLLKNFKCKLSDDLTQIYQKTLETKDWVGCDIWGFFSNKDIDKYCISDKYRNILIILTDGYIFHQENKIKDNNDYSYILPQTLANPESGLIVKRTDLKDIEVLILEVNPYDPKTTEQISSILKKWLTEMGVTKLEISQTAMPKNTETVIDKFLGF